MRDKDVSVVSVQTGEITQGEEMSEKVILAAAEQAWRDWHADIPGDYVPSMPPLWKRAWMDAVKWVQTSAKVSAKG